MVFVNECQRPAQSASRRSRVQMGIGRRLTYRQNSTEFGAQRGGGAQRALAQDADGLGSGGFRQTALSQVGWFSRCCWSLRGPQSHGHGHGTALLANDGDVRRSLRRRLVIRRHWTARAQPESETVENQQDRICHHRPVTRAPPTSSHRESLRRE